MTDILFATFLNMVKEPHIQNTHTHLESPIQRSLNSHTLGWKGTPGPCVGWLWLQMLKGGGNASNVLVNVMSDLNCVLAIGLYVWGRYTQLPYHQLITTAHILLLSLSLSPHTYCTYPHRWLVGKGFPMWSTQRFGAGQISTRMNFAMPSIASMPSTWSVTTCVWTHTIMREFRHKVRSYVWMSLTTCLVPSGIVVHVQRDPPFNLALKAVMGQWWTGLLCIWSLSQVVYMYIWLWCVGLKFQLAITHICTHIR